MKNTGKNLRRILGCVCMLLCICIGNIDAEAAQEEMRYLIGVATIFEDATWDIQKQYFTEVLGPALNMEFLFSEKLNNANELTDFMERARAAGCQGIINFVTSNDAVEAGVNLAEEYGIWFVTQNSMLDETVATAEHNLGHVGASVGSMEEAYYRLVSELIEKEDRKGFFIYTGSAPGGSQGAGAASHYYSVKGMLDAIADEFDLTYNEEIETSINSAEAGPLASSREDVKIYLSPGTSLTGAVNDARAQLSTGHYDTFLTVNSYSSFTNAVASSEGATGINIMMAATVSVNKMTKAGFETTDASGDTVLHGAVVNPLNVANAMCSVLIYNALTGHADEMKQDGHAVLFEVEPWICYSADDYMRMEKLDSEEAASILDSKELGKLLVENDSSVTYEDIRNKLAELADIDAILEKKQFEG